MVILGRGLVAAGLGVYAAIHLAQAVGGPESSPGWLTVAFLLAAIAGFALAVGVFVSSRWREVVVAAFVLTAASLVALTMAYTVGFFGVDEGELTPSTLAVIVAEVMTMLGVVAALFGDRFHLDEETSIRQAKDENRLITSRN